MNAVLICGSGKSEVDCINVAAILICLEDGKTVVLTENSLRRVGVERLDAANELAGSLLKHDSGTFRTPITPVTSTVSIRMVGILQEVGDFAILLNRGYRRTKAVLLNGLSAAATLPGAVIAYFRLGETGKAVPYILALSAASFIYMLVQTWNQVCTSM